MYMHTNDGDVAATLTVPDTFEDLDACLAETLLLRVVARSLVLWDSTEATEEWLVTQVAGVLVCEAAQPVSMTSRS